MTNDTSSIWEAEVRDYEVDFQGIVNNAYYFHYFDHARSLYLKKAFEIDVTAYAKNNINIVLIHTETSFKFPLKFGDSFYITTDLERLSRFKFKLNQKLFLSDSKKISADSNNILASITADGKPYFIKELESISLANENVIFS